ncbi:MAG: hypothetical protein JSW27_23085 [Phycisphaerales bacterium]|nr:MAG: hypothetical protein JSW27_23085 [Phycisphaerales bacterium]
MYRPKLIRVFFGGVTAVFLVAAAYFGRGFYQRAMTIHELLGENKELKQAISTLTTEDQIGYAKVISQRTEGDHLLTTLRFVETSRDDKTRKILQKEYTIEGDVIHFDALIVKFDDQMVMDGKARALYLWRRVYGEKMTPEQGFPIEEPGAEPKRYQDLLKVLPIKHQELFWSSIWDLANNPEQLGQHGIRAIYGNVIYSQLREGLIYVFKIGPTGHLYVEDVFDM